MIGAMVEISSGALNRSRPPAESTAALSVADAYLADFIRRVPGLEPGEAEALLQWWLADRHPGESFAAFLTHQGILGSGATKTLELMQKGYVQLEHASHLLQGRLPERFRSASLSPAKSPISSPPPQAATATIFSVSTDRAPAAQSLPGAPHEPVDMPALEIGSMLGKCLLTEVLGQGACGMVFRALHRGLNIPVAVKVIQKQLLGDDPQVYQRLRSEARMLAQLNHPHVVRVLDFEEDTLFPYVVMELVEGLSLAELILQSGSLRLYKAVRTISQIAQGLAAAQRLGVVHRDVKPGNILLAKDGTAKLADLGLAVAADGPSRAQCLGVGLPQGELAGTVAYMAPEQFAAPAAVDYRADIYALGATFYHALTGQVPFAGNTSMEVMIKHVEEQPAPPHQLVPECDPAVTDIIFRMMAKKPGDRFQSYDDILEALVHFAKRNLDKNGTSPSYSTDSFSSATSLRPSRWKGLWSYLSREKGPTPKGES